MFLRSQVRRVQTWKITKKVWRDITPEYLQKLNKSMPRQSLQSLPREEAIANIDYDFSSFYSMKNTSQLYIYPNRWYTFLLGYTLIFSCVHTTLKVTLLLGPLVSLSVGPSRYWNFCWKAVSTASLPLPTHAQLTLSCIWTCFYKHAMSLEPWAMSHKPGRANFFTLAMCLFLQQYYSYEFTI